MVRSEPILGSKIRAYFYLTKPGIILGNCIAGTGGFMLAAKGHPNFLLYALTMLGIALIVASGCVLNNIIDTDIDSLMTRTQKRALVVGKISKRSAAFYAYILGILGFATLYVYTNMPTFLFGVFGFHVYVILYSVFYKRSTVHATLIGSASGASPPVIGYLAVTAHVDLATLLIFLGFCFWQIPHSYAIGIFRENDYKASAIPLLPSIKGVKSAQSQMLIYVFLYWLSFILLFVYHYVGYVSVAIMSAVCLRWIYQIVVLFKPEHESFNVHQWGKQLFFSSIWAVSFYSLMIGIDFMLI